MFTGLVRAVGTLRPLSANSMRIECGTIAAAQILPNLELGDSVAVDGVCLTVTEILPQGFTADVSPETLDRTTLGRQSELTYVNLEPSLQVGSKIGGHFVTGHIDGTGYLESAVQTEISWEMSFRVGDARVARYIVPKGSVTVNGVSLTVAECTSTGNWFKVAVIPVTYAETNLHYLQPGSPVNLEGDVLGKYVEKFLRLGANPEAIADLEALIQPSNELTPAFLAEHGYL
ncbi:riboflavin synthase [Phormidium tenue FACHB-886]|nr:riboflavin synthase [Phormidium tenue FACHB-886]